MRLSFCRSQMAKQILNNSQINNFASNRVTRRVWDDFEIFVKDNLIEVHKKLEKIEMDIWGKLIIMERNFRTAKAYLRHNSVIVDGSDTQFDGTKIGLSKFHQDSNEDLEIKSALNYLGRGIYAKIDNFGNLWMKKCQDSADIFVHSLAIPETVVVLERKFKNVLDLNTLKNYIEHEILREVSKIEDLFAYSFIFIQIMSQAPSATSPELHKLSREDPLRCPLWLALIHLVVIEMTNMLLINHEKRRKFLLLHERMLTSNSILPEFSSESPPASFASSLTFKDSLSYEALSTGKESTSSFNPDHSCTSSSALNSSSTRQLSTRIGNNGVAKRIITNQINCIPNFNKNTKSSFKKTGLQKRFLPTPFLFSDHISFNNMEKTDFEGLTDCLEYQNLIDDVSQYENIQIDLRREAYLNYDDRDKNLEEYNEGLSPKDSEKMEFRYKTGTGWSMLNLHEIDKLRNPVYFRNSENDNLRQTKRGGMGHLFNRRKNNPNNTLLQIHSPEPVIVLKKPQMKWKSECDLRQNIRF